MKTPLTLREIEALETEVLTCQQVSRVLCAGAYYLHEQAMKDPAKLGFPVIVHGTRVKIPKQPFIRFMKEGKV